MRTFIALFLTLSMLLAPCATIGLGARAQAGVAAAAGDRAADRGDASGTFDGIPFKKPCRGLKATATRPSGAPLPEAAASQPGWGLPAAWVALGAGRFDGVARPRAPPERIAWVSFRDIHAVTSRLLN